jgi:type I restriction enzyme S subunit
METIQMQKVKRLVPELRFKGFDDDWNKAELNDFASINPKNTELPNSFIYIDLESVTNGVLLKEERIFKDNSPSRAQRLLEKNDILYQTVRPYQKNNLYFDKTGEYVASTGYAQIRTKNASKFLFHFLHTEKLVQNVMLRCTGTSYPSINSSDLSKIKISFPSLPEQTKIASFLTAVDDKLQALKHKLTLLEQYKKGVMQKIFAQELRFKPSPIEALEIGDEYPDWEEKKLGEIAYINKGKQLNKENLTETGQYLCINGGISPSGFTHDFNTLENTITISEGGNSCGFINFFKTKFWSGGHNYTIEIINSNETDNDFLFQLLKQNQNEIMSLRVGSGLPNIQKKDLIIFSFQQPISILEQTKIASFLSAIDEKIEKTTQLLTQTETFKKGLLQKMFV